MRVTVPILVAAVLAACSPETPRGEPRVAASPDAAYQVFPPTNRFGEVPKSIFENSGNVPLEYPHEFALARLDEGVWRTLQSEEDPEWACGSGSATVLHPGHSESQHLRVCDWNSLEYVLPPGTYRVTKTVLTIPTQPEEEPIELRETAEFAIAEASGDVPGPDECEILCISDTRVEPGQTVRVTFDPPLRYAWGVPSHLHAGTAPTLLPVAYLTAWQTRDKEIMTFFPGEGVGWEDIGFQGRGSWRWTVPTRLEPGIYSIVKEGIRGGRKPLADRMKLWVVSFEVTG